MFFRPFVIVLLLLGLVVNSLAQTVSTTDDAKKKEEDLRKDAVAFLRETSAEVATLRSIENRISLSSEMAGLMWLYDEKEAATMYRSVISDFNQLLTEYDSQINSMQIVPDESDYRRSVFGGDQSEKTKLTQKFYRAMGVRKSIALGIAEHDAELAYDFYTASLSLITNNDLRKMFEGGENYFDATLLKKMAEQNPAKALEFGRRSIKNKEIGWVQFEMLRSLYQKDNEKGAEFASDMFRQAKLQPKPDSRITAYAGLLRIAAESGGKNAKKKPMFTNDGFREVAEALAQDVLAAKNPNFDASGYASLVEQYLPSRAMQIRAKFPPKRDDAASRNYRDDSTEMDPPIIKAPPLARDVVVDQKNETELSPAEKDRKDLEAGVAKLGGKELPKEEREKIVAQARKVIGGLGSRTEKILAISMLAGQIKAADPELASEIMRDAMALVNPQPKNYRDYLEMWLVVSAFSGVEPDKAFPLLEEGIFRLNDTLSAFIKVAEFIDVSGEAVDDGEVQVGAFGGEMISGLTRELGTATPTIRNLATADFARTKALTSKFDRPEIRVLAKMLVLRAVLDKAKQPEKDEPLTASPDFGTR